MQRYGANRTLVSDVFLAPIARRYDFSVQVPVPVSGELNYYLTMGINASLLEQLFLDHHFPQEWIVTVIDRNGAVVTRTRDNDKFVGTTVRAYS
jgi:hypothetical protein